MVLQLEDSALVAHLPARCFHQQGLTASALLEVHRVQGQGLEAKFGKE